MIPRHNKKRANKAARTGRAETRALETGNRHYSLSVEDIDEVTEQIKTGKSSFVFRWGKLGIHRILSAVGTVFAAYDSSVKMITFFIPRDTGLKMAKGKRGSAWGKKRSGVILLPRLPKKPPRRPNEGTQGEDDGPPLTPLEILTVRKGLERRVEVLQAAIDEKMGDDPGKHWDSIKTMGLRMEELQDILAELPTEKELVKQLDDAFEGEDDKDETRRRHILGELDDIECAITTCHVNDLKEKVDKLNDLKEELANLIPNAEGGDRRLALVRATEQLQTFAQEFQRGRDYGPGEHIITDREKMASLRSRLRTLTAMHKALFGTSYFKSEAEEAEATGEVVAESEAGDTAPLELTDGPTIEPAPDPVMDGAAPSSSEEPRGWEAVKARYNFLAEEIEGLSERLQGPANGTNADFFYQRFLYDHERKLLLRLKAIRSKPDEVIEQHLRGSRIMAIRDFIKWYRAHHTMTLQPHRERVQRYRAQLSSLYAEYAELYPQAESGASA